MTYRVTREEVFAHCLRMLEPQVDRGSVTDWIEEDARRLRYIAYRSFISPTTGKRVVRGWDGIEYEVREPVLSRLLKVPNCGILVEEAFPYPSA